jgi:acyl-CoA synthetase (AMP-forming)/AMP-acid ligase II
VISSGSTNTPEPKLRSLAATLGAQARAPILNGVAGTLTLSELARATSLAGALEPLAGKNVVLMTGDALATALALVELDGLARRLVLATPDLPPEHVEHLRRTAAADAIVYDAATAEHRRGFSVALEGGTRLTARATRAPVAGDSEWILLTSGTTGAPKLVLHTLESLAGGLAARETGAQRVWGTFYDIRRYGGLQIFLRAVIGGTALVLPGREEPVAEFLSRAGAQGVTHISGTPSHWRKALMSAAARRIAPVYVRLSGEIADQALLDALASTYPQATIAHAFASTEAGLAFEVGDGRAGFPAELLQRPGPVELKVERDTLRVRSPRIATRYLDPDAPALVGADGYVDTGDLLERRGERCFFVGRSGGVINVGGAKVYAEEVEAVINGDPRVRMARVRARKSPITGAVLVAEVVLTEQAAAHPAEHERIRNSLLERCRDRLQSHKVPTMLSFVAALPLTPAGKLIRPDA